ncbi:MAG: HaeIII family restriction endonuclease [Kiritimatiellaeota bacterium]|nr:HaeIII family restriction endonuclease [Kiritimatiellota bacterium]
MMATQALNGKAFEYALATQYAACVKARGLAVEVTEDAAYAFAKKSYLALGAAERRAFDAAAMGSAETLLALEPGLRTQKSPDDKLAIRLAADAEGMQGDVRDVIFSRKDAQGRTAWETGISAKNNHEAVKHARLSPSIDFGQEWIGHPCSSGYFAAAEDIFARVKAELALNPQATWEGLGERKERDIYMPLLEIFRDELLRLNTVHASDVPPQLLIYLIGRKPFYKVIKQDRQDLVIVKAFNLGGRLNQPYNGAKPRVSCEKLPLPSRIIEFTFKTDSLNTLNMVMDKGWQVSFRIHNANAKLELSLKFDIQLVGNPSNIFTHYAFLAEAGGVRDRALV